MCGIGMLTLTGNTISMDVFGPVADNANGIGEMGYDKKEMGEAQYKESRQTLADLDAVGNTTKAITKGIAIGSAVIAAVSLFASFIAVLVTGSEEKIGQLLIGDFVSGASKLTVAEPLVFIGMLIGGAVPFLFSAMTIRAVGRAAYLIVFECRRQFNDPEIMSGKKTPDYGRVVNICTAAAQGELIGPGLLAIVAPILVGIAFFGLFQAIFMANAGGAWDNAKKIVEVDLRQKGTDLHAATVVGDTVGDPFKDTSSVALNPVIKFTTLFGLLATEIVVKMIEKEHAATASPFTRYLIGGVLFLVALIFVYRSFYSMRIPEEDTGTEDTLVLPHNVHGTAKVPANPK